MKLSIFSNDEMLVEKDQHLYDYLNEIILESNIEIHKEEAKYYDLMHSEIYNIVEQFRLKKYLKKIDKCIDDNQKNAIDFGSGTGNITCKLLNMGYKVVAIDISKEMCELLKNKCKYFIKNNKLIIINKNIMDVELDYNSYDLITCYSVLHHLPDYISVLEKFSIYLKKGGVFYLDHEKSPFYWESKNENKDRIKLLYQKLNKDIRNIYKNYLKIIGINLPILNYSYSDFWTKKEHHLDHKNIKYLFKNKNFQYYKRIDYHLHTERIINPLFIIYKYVCEPDTSLWIAKK